MTRAETLTLLQRYLGAVEQGATGEALAQFYTADAMFIEHPNKLNPKGGASDLAAILAAAERGQAVIARQSFELKRAVIEGEHAALALSWTGVIKVDLPGLKSGAQMRAQFAQFYTLREGRISRQETFDCFES